MQFHLQYTPIKSSFEIKHQHQLFLIGSCFSENIHQKLIDLKFNSFSNPNGILFNPISIYQALNTAVNLPITQQAFIIKRDGLYYSFLHHTIINDSNSKILQQKIQEIEILKTEKLKSCHYLFITFGTAYYFLHKTLNIPVANCHKQAQQEFEKRKLSVNEIVETYHNLIHSLVKINPQLKIIFTVSPVKHLKDGLIENNLSKATLLLSVNEICNLHSNCFYFPAFELVNDDLRDYRFYKQDMAHPNEQAIDYVWEKFSDCYFNSDTKKINEEIEKLNSFIHHRHLHPTAKVEQDASNFILKQKEIIQKLYPQIQF